MRENIIIEFNNLLKEAGKIMPPLFCEAKKEQIKRDQLDGSVCLDCDNFICIKGNCDPLNLGRSK